jgi:hypothetical protein
MLSGASAHSSVGASKDSGAGGFLALGGTGSIFPISRSATFTNGPSQRRSSSSAWVGCSGHPQIFGHNVAVDLLTSRVGSSISHPHRGADVTARDTAAIIGTKRGDQSPS